MSERESFLSLALELVVASLMWAILGLILLYLLS